MANVHILECTDRSEYRAAMHIAIPNANNAVGINWRTALLRSGRGGKTVLPDGDGTGGTISTAEKASITSGAVLEVTASVRAATVALANINAYLDAEYARISGETLDRLQAELKYYGATR